MYTLEEVVNAFESWRSSRKSKREAIPDRLWSMAKALVPHYKKCHIQRALRVSGGQFNERCLKEEQGRKDMIKDGFVSGIFEPIQSIHANDCELTLRGLQKSLHIKVNIQQLPQILTLMSGYL